MFDEYGSLCGLVCANVDGSHQSGESISFVTTLWPLFTLIVDGDRGDNYPRDVRYPAIELARDGQIHVADRSKLIDWFEAHIDPGVSPQSSEDIPWPVFASLECPARRSSSNVEDIHVDARAGVR